MKLKITWQYLIAFIALNMIAGEIHEQVHINTGYFICGCYGARDFNVWHTCASCSNPSLAILSTLAGPVFSCSLMWLGAYWFTGDFSTLKKSFGFSLLFANLPFARIFTALTGGGDEKVVLQFLMGETTSSLIVRILASIIVLSICLPPIILVFNKLRLKQRWWIVTGFAILPLLFGMLYQRMIWNRLLHGGLGATVHLLGTPDLILFHLVLMIILLMIFRKALNQLII